MQSAVSILRAEWLLNVLNEFDGEGVWCRMQEVNQQWFQSEFIKANVNKVS